MNPPATAKEVTREQFFSVIGPKNVHPSPLGEFPYLSAFKTPSGAVVGWIKDGGHAKESKYFLP